MYEFNVSKYSLTFRASGTVLVSPCGGVLTLVLSTFGCGMAPTAIPCIPFLNPFTEVYTYRKERKHFGTSTIGSAGMLHEHLPANAERQEHEAGHAHPRPQ